MSQKIITVALGLACIILTAIGGFLYLMSDRVGPEIVPNDKITSYDASDDISVLLEGVEAVDKVDGDVSDSLIVESIIPMADGLKVKVVYAAKDKSNNITKTEIVIEYTGAQVKAEDADKTSEGQAGEDNEQDAEETSAPAEQEPQEEPPAQAEDGEMVDVENPDKSELVASGAAPKIRLNKLKVHLPVGSAFRAMDYVGDIADDKDNVYDLYRRVNAVGADKVSMNKAGTYEVKYYVIDSDGNESNTEVLTVVVY